MTRSIEISDDLYALLEREARPFVETTPEAVLRRLLRESPNGEPAQAAKSYSSTGARSTRPKDQRRAPRGSLLPESEYEIPILRALEDRGGSAPSRTIVQAVGKAVADKLTEPDKEPLKSGDIRWENRVQFTRLRLVDEGFLKKDSPRGTWEISPKGRERLSQAEPSE